MKRRLTVALVFALGIVSQTSFHASKAYLNDDKVLVIDGQKVFPIGFTMPPPLDGKSPRGKNAIKELADTGATFLRTGPMGHAWDKDALQDARHCLDVAAKNKMHVWVNLRETSAIRDDRPENEAMLHTIVTLCKDHPGMGAWKGEDEPEWGQRPSHRWNEPTESLSHSETVIPS